MATETLSFDKHLRHAFVPLSSRLEGGIRSLDAVIEVLRLRIEAEKQFTSSLKKIISNKNLLNNLNEFESLRKDGLEALYSDIRNEYMQRIEFLNSLNEVVYEPCISIRELYVAKNRLFANDTKQNIKSLRQQQNQFYKIKRKYDKLNRDLNNARTTLLNLKLNMKTPTPQYNKLRSKLSNMLKTQQSLKEKYDQQQLLWNKQIIKFDDKMTSTLQGMQTNEFNRMKTTKDALNKWAVFITNLCANRNYDVKNLVESMSLINIENDLQIFIKETLKQHPPQNHTQSSSIFGNQLQNNLNIPDTPNGTFQHNMSREASSLSSFGASYGDDSTLERRESSSYSLSDHREHDPSEEITKKPLQRQSSNSIRAFFQNKFKKDRSFHSSQRSEDHDPVVYPSSIDEAPTPDTKPFSLNLKISAVNPQMLPLNDDPLNYPDPREPDSSRLHILEISKKKKIKYQRPQTPVPMPPKSAKKKSSKRRSSVSLPSVRGNKKSNDEDEKAYYKQNIGRKQIKYLIANPNNKQYTLRNKKGSASPTYIVNGNNNLNINGQQILISSTKPKSKSKMKMQPKQIIIIKRKKSTPPPPPMTPQNSTNDTATDINNGALEQKYNITKSSSIQDTKYDNLLTQTQILNNDNARQQSILLCTNIEKINVGGIEQQFGFLKYLQNKLNENIVMDIFNKSKIKKSNDNIIMASQFVSILKFTVIAYKTDLYELQKTEPKQEKLQFNGEKIKTSIKHVAIWCFRKYGTPQNKVKNIKIINDEGSRINVNVDLYQFNLTSTKYLQNIYKWIQNYVDKKGQHSWIINKNNN